jgi:glycosyltransferase involved in cell wall biosynthesis
VRIHFFTDYFRPEPPPPAHHIAERARIWASLGHDVTVITNHPNYPEGLIYPGHRNLMRSLESVDGYRVLRVWTYVAHHTARLGKLADHASYCASAVAQALRLEQPDAVVATSPHLFCGVAGALYARIRGRPLLLEVRDLWPDSVLPRGSASYRTFKILERFIYREAAAVSVLTPAFEDHVLGEGARRAVTIVGGADTARFRPGDAPPGVREGLGLEGKFVIGYPGTLGTAHDIEFLIDVASRLSQTELRFLLIGGGPFMERARASASSQCPGMISFLSTQPPERMPDWWRAMDAGLVLLRKTEAMRTVIPSKIFECMATGLPTIFIGPRGAGSRVVEDHCAGIVLDDPDPARVAEQLTALVSDRERVRALSAGALAASPRFTRERQAEATIAVLRELTSEMQR